MITLLSASPGTSTPVQKLSVPNNTLWVSRLNSLSNGCRGSVRPCTRSVHRRALQRHGPPLSGAALDPVDMPFLILIQERLQRLPRRAQALGHLAKLQPGMLALGFVTANADTMGDFQQREAQRVLHQFRPA